MSLVEGDSEAEERTLRWNRALRTCLNRRIKHINVLIRNNRKRDEREFSSHVAPSSHLTKPGECEVCKKILLLFKTPLHEYKSVYLGAKDYILSLPCKAHSRLFAEVLPDRRYPEFFQSSIQGISGSKLKHKKIVLLCVASPSPIAPQSPPLNLLVSNPRLGLKSTAQMVHPQWIKHSLPRQWKEHCDCRHGTECRRVLLATLLARGRPKWIIDVWRSCLVPGSLAAEYVALSYVWGERSFVTTTKDNIDCFQSPGALSTLPLPYTIRDALGFTEMLGVRYLWVDSLCIVQDDTNAKYAEMENMSAIYVNASVTIIVSDGRDAYAGLAGLQGISFPRAYKQAIFDLDHGSKISLQQQYRHESVWSTRAWTFQESLFSNRRIIFENDCVRWECSKAFWYEDVLQRDGDGSVPMKSGAMLSSNFPDLRGLYDLVRVYNYRDLSYPEDALNAFTGIMRALSPAFKSGFLSGLPLVFFNSALLWQPQGYAVRRVARKGVSGANCLPSWSWAGWKCSIETSQIENDYIKHHSFCRSSFLHDEVVIPHVQWHSHRDLHAIGTPIPTDWYEYRKNYLNTEAAPPAGWTKHTIHESSSKFIRWPDWFLKLENEPKCFYKHESDPNSEFWYPIPLPSTTDESISIVSEPYLSCRTHRGWAFGGKYRHYRGDTPVLDLNDKNKREIGFLKLLESSPLKNGQNDDSEKKYLGQPIELVDIAIGYHHASPYPAGDRFHYVMWIEWEDKVAYRKGLGEVSMEVWEEQDPELIYLMLG
ncbi:HET-domain-containing protein [Hyaloscypha hepaticicola]|uniref:HET-domain-containing protein n=1 Tax=Hyaloscypha hepaticicola TaxID=2082293 RepID=A0A2J6Q7Q6_9HELO|nr:HET-domain-containing protein [Hyaloscypha hepaticicola]